MLKIRVMPTLLWKNVGLVKGIGFESWRRTGPILPAIKVYGLREVDEMVVLDITATREKREPDYDSIAEWSSECFVPLTIGGGVRDVATIRKLLQAGADKVCINSAAYENPGFIRRAADMFGSQCIVVAIDSRRTPGGSYACYSHCGNQNTGKEPGHWAKQMEELGAGEILVTSIERDGTMEGYDLDLIRTVTSQVGISVIASGGAGNYQHMFEAVSAAGASAVAAASVFQFTEQTPLEAKKYLAQKGIPVRSHVQASCGMA